MADMNKLREGEDLAARLLRAGAREQPRQTARRRAERALGLSTAAAGVAVTSSAAATGSAAGLGSASPLAVVIFGKWLAVGMLAGGAAAGGVTAMGGALGSAAQSVEGSPSPAITSAPLANVGGPEVTPGRTTPNTNSTPASGGAPSRQRADDAGHTTELRQARSPGDSPPSTPASEPESSRAPSAVAGSLALSREVELLEGVRIKLRSGNSGAALAELDAVGGDIRILRMEADLLRVEALLANGERSRAEALAAELQRRDPRGGQNFRLKRLLGGR